MKWRSPLETQIALLRVLQERDLNVWRNEMLRSEVRVIARHRDLHSRSRRFVSSDLFYGSRFSN